MSIPRERTEDACAVDSQSVVDHARRFTLRNESENAGLSALDRANLYRMGSIGCGIDFEICRLALLRFERETLLVFETVYQNIDRTAVRLFQHVEIGASKIGRHPDLLSRFICV